MLDIVAWARRFVSTPSVSRDGNAASAALAAELLEEAGASPRRVPAIHDGREHFTVLADLGPAPEADSDGLLLVTHLDTVPPGDPALWTETGGDPFRPVEKDDRLYGLGSADAKVDLVCKAAALAELDPGLLARPLRVAGTFAEEIGLVGARWLVGSGHTRGFRYALVGEPSELAAIRAHKGYSVWQARIPLEPAASRSGGVVDEELVGRSAHSSTPHLGTNAIEAALERLAANDVRGVVALEGGGAVNQIPASCALRALVNGAGAPAAGEVFGVEPLVAFHLAWRDLLARLAETKDLDFDPDCTVGNLGRIVLRDGAAELGFDLRPIPGVDARAALEPLEEQAELRMVRVNPALATPRESKLVAAVVAAQHKLGQEEQVTTKATCTEAGLLAEAGLEAVVIGAGASVGNVHRPNEHTRISQLGRARDLYREVITSLCVEAA